MAGHSKPVPIPDAFTTPFWEATARKTLLLPHCPACSRAHWYPRPFCPHCYEQSIVWKPASGRATLHSFTIVGRNDPEIVAYAELEEGPIILTNIVDTDPSDVAIGAALMVSFEQRGDVIFIPVFRGA